MNILSICILHVYRIHIDKILNSIMTEAKSEVRSQSCKKTSNETVVSLARLSLSVADLVSGKVVNYYISYVPSKECKSGTSPQIMAFVYQRVPRQTFAISQIKILSLDMYNFRLHLYTKKMLGHTYNILVRFDL